MPLTRLTTFCFSIRRFFKIPIKLQATWSVILLFPNVWPWGGGSVPVSPATAFLWFHQQPFVPSSNPDRAGWFGAIWKAVVITNKHREGFGSCIKLPPSSSPRRRAPAPATSMTSQSQGIQQLLQAEKRAKDKLEEAKKSKHLACFYCLFLL